MSTFASVPKNGYQPLSADLRERLWAVPTANIGDAMERLGVMDPAIHPVWSGARCVGTAHTVWTRAGDNRYIHEALESVQPGDVIVVSGQADESRALIGELIGGKAKLQGVEGFVIDGAVRDAPGLAEYAMPVFARTVTAAGPYKNGPGVVGATIAVGGVPVNPGDIIVGDADGVVVIPRQYADQVVAGAEAKRDAEQATRDRIDSELLDRAPSAGVGAPG
ncbi:regulator of RNase E activity RraA [Arthrobacter pigmenti]|uniref:Putative 4-hydroxy-4-methyl-2-oxoglutarate aldolase n=1 Tax=Arthrobacter pigmenti TaxID=271432 RepID=A0A846RZU4_9MICC|nr:methyltransferase [Arthrobacter pigmenti]NJC23701.1 regulator of RNase E activity RraA [Arthrobacter pigmenti]